MIDLGFLTEAEQEAILQVLQRDAELKKAEEERIRHLQDVVSDENELKYKSGQWFYEAKSKRHRDKIHGADLVRASIRKRKKPATIAELSEMSKSKSKRRSVNSVNKDLFIPPELHGVMEAPDEADEDLTIDKAETNQSSKRVSFSPPDKDKDILKNGLSSPAKQRKNPFNSEGLEEVTDLGGDTTDSRPEDVQVNGQPEKKPDIMSSVIKYGVKLPYPELTGGRRISQKAADDSPPKPEPQYPVPKPVPKPRTFYTNGQVPQQTDSPLKREDSFNGTNRRGILKRRSSSSSTDSESMRIPHSIESNKIVLPVSPIPEASQNYLFDEQPATSEGSPERQKQVRFSEKVQQKPPSPKPEPYSVRETDEFGILEPGLYSDSESVPVQFPHSAVDYNDSAEIIGQNGLREKPSISSSDAEEHLVDPDDEISDHKVQTILEERPPERSVDYNDTEALYATVDKTPKSASSDQAQVFAMEDAIREPRFLGQGGKTSNKYQNEKPLVFGQSYGGGGKINFEPRYPTRNPKESFNFTREQVLAPERVTHVESPYYDLENKTMTMPQYDDDSTVSVATWRRPAILENRESLREPPTDDTEQNQKPSTFTVEKVPRVDFKEQDRLSNTNPENELNSKYFPGEYKREAKYESLLLRNTHNANYRPAGPTLKSANFKVMSLKERMNELPRQQMSDPAQFQSLKHFWNVEEKNSQRADVGTSPNKLPTDILSRNKPTRADLKQRNSKEMPTDDLILPNTFDSLSEEEQNSQKVASWLAQTPTVYGVDQVDHSEETFDPSEVTENIQISSANKRNKPEAFASALQRPQIEALESRRITEPEKLRTQEISAVSLNSMDNSSPAANIKTADRSFYEQVLKRSNKPSSGKETKSIVLDIPTMHTVQSEHNGGEAVEETVSKTVAPAKEKSAFNIGFEKLQAEYAKPHEEHQTDELRLPNENLSNEEANEPEEVIKKSAAPKSRDQLDFILSLNKLEMEASKPPPLPNEIQDDLPDKEIALNTVSPVESSYKIGIEHISSAKDNGQFDSPIEDSITFQAPIYYPPDNDHTAEVANEDEETVEKTTVPNVESDLHSALKKLQAEYAKSHEEYQTDESNLPIENPSEEDAHESEEVIKKSVAPKSRDQVDFILSLNKLEMEASKPPLRPIENQDSQPDEEITLNTVSPVKSSYNIGFEHFSTNEANDHRTFPIEQPLSYQAPVYYPPSNDHSAEVTNEVEETVGKTTVPNVESDLSSALKKLELEAQSINENVEQDHEESNTYPTLQVNKNMAQSIYINSSKDLSPTEKTQPDLQLPYSSKDGRSVAEVEEPPMEDKQIFQIELPKSTVDTQENLPVAEEEAIERTVVKTQENNDFQNQLMRLQDEATTISEEPEDLSVSDTVTVSQFPNRKIISKTVFPSIESIPRYTYDTHDSEKTNEVTVNESSPWNKPEDPTEQMSPVYSRLEKLAKHPRSADKSGSYQGSARNVHYKKPENSTGVSNSEPGMEDPILSALKRSTAKTLNSKAVQEVSPTSTNKVNLETPNQDALAPTTNSFPDNAEKYKRMSQSVPAFPQDDTDGRETDSASESSFQIGRHKKSPSSLTNLSGSSGMASMSSVSGSVMSMYSGDFGNVDVKGSMEFSLEYVDQLKEFLIYIYQCKELSAADTKKQRSDPYVKAYLLPEKSKMGKRKTAVKKKTLSPVYNEILRYKIPYESLINQTLNLSVWHHDVLGRNSFLGEVNVNLETWDWKNKEKSWYALEPRTPAAGVGLEHRGEVKLSLKYNPESPAGTGPKAVTTGEVHIWIKECLQLPMLREKKINSFVKCTILPDTSRKSRQKTRTVDKTPNPIFNHTMVYDGFKEEDLREACVELTVWDHTRLSNHFIGGLRLGLGTGKSYGTPVDWMDSSHEETTMWQRMIASPNTWVEGLLPLRMFKMAKIDK